MTDPLKLFTDKEADYQLADSISLRIKEVEKVLNKSNHYCTGFTFLDLVWKDIRGKYRLCLSTQMYVKPLLECNAKDRVDIGVDGIDHFLSEFAIKLGLKNE